MKKASDEDDEEDDIDWQDDIEDEVHNDEDEEDEQIQWMDDVHDGHDEFKDNSNTGVKFVRGSEAVKDSEEDKGIIVHIGKKENDRNLSKRNSKKEKKLHKNGTTIRKRKQLPFTQLHEDKAIEHHKELLEQSIYNLKQQKSLFYDDHLVALLQSMLPEQLLSRSHKVSKCLTSVLSTMYVYIYIYIYIHVCMCV